VSAEYILGIYITYFWPARVAGAERLPRLGLITIYGQYVLGGY